MARFGTTPDAVDGYKSHHQKVNRDLQPGLWRKHHHSLGDRNGGRSNFGHILIV